MRLQIYLPGAVCYSRIGGYAITMELALYLGIFLGFLTEGIQDFPVVLHDQLEGKNLGNILDFLLI